MCTRPADFTGADILRMATELSAIGQPFALGIVVEVQGSSSGQVGAKALFDAEGTVIAGWVGGGCAESAVAQAAVETCASGKAQLVDIDLDSEVLGAGMPCGGRMRVYVEPILPLPALWILGHGRIAECLCHLGVLMGFEVIVDDVMARAERFPEASCVITDDPGYEAVTPAAGDFAVVATQHRGDHDSLGRLLASEVGHIALIASRKRAGLVLSHLRNAGFGPADLDRVRAPAGLVPGAGTPEEIALSVIGEIVLVRRSRTDRGAAAQAGDVPAAAPGEVRPPVTLAAGGSLRAIGG